MGSYAPKQIQAMAAEAVRAERARDNRWTMLVLHMCVRTGLSSDAVVRQIQHLAHSAPQEAP